MIKNKIRVPKQEERDQAINFEDDFVVLFVDMSNVVGGGVVVVVVDDDDDGIYDEGITVVSGWREVEVKRNMMLVVVECCFC